MVKQKPNIYGLASDNAEYVGSSRLINSNVEFTEKLCDFNNNQLGLKLKDTKETKVFLPFDGSDIRKPSTKKSEKIDRVRGLDGKIVNGYHSYNTIAVTEHCHEVSILEHTVFSTKQEDFLSKTDITLKLIESTSNSIKSINPKLTRIFILDREFDNQRLFEEMDNRGDKFVVRCKTLDRLVCQDKDDTTNTTNTTNTTINLNKIKFKNKTTKKIKELKIRSKTFQNLTLKLQWQKLGITNKYGETDYYTFIKAKLLDSDKKSIFQEDREFTIVTNQDANSAQEVYQAYLNYFIRWKIETVFKFLKDTLGLEEFRTPKLKAIKNIIALVFLVGAYLFQLGEVNVDDEFIVHLANLGDGKGQVTPFFIRQGLAKLINHLETSEYLKRLKDSDQERLKSFGAGRCVGV